LRETTRTKHSPSVVVDGRSNRRFKEEKCKERWKLFLVSFLVVGLKANTSMNEPSFMDG
jgi:hypothetical protein